MGEGAEVTNVVSVIMVIVGKNTCRYLKMLAVKNEDYFFKSKTYSGGYLFVLYSS